MLRTAPYNNFAYVITPTFEGIFAFVQKLVPLVHRRNP